MNTNDFFRADCFLNLLMILALLLPIISLGQTLKTMFRLRIVDFKNQYKPKSSGQKFEFV